MSRRAVGCAFIAIAAFLYAARFISAAIFGSGVQSWNQELFLGMLQYVGSGLHLWALIALLAGVAYLIWGEWSDRKARGG